MVQFNGPHGKVTVSYLRQGGLNPPAPAPEGSFAGKTVVITGCSSGIGYQAALQIATLCPKKLILGTRTLAKGQFTKKSILAQVPFLDSAAVQVIPIECSSLASVRAFAAAVGQSCPDGIDAILLSVGLALPVREVVVADNGQSWPTTFVVNVLAPALLSLELLPLLHATGGVLEFVNSISYCNVTSEDIAELLDNPHANSLEFFNGPGRWTTQRAYYEAKLMLMFVLQGLVDDLDSGKLRLVGEKSSGGKTPIVLACCPGQCKTNLYRQFPLTVRMFMMAFNAVIARTAEQGARTLVTGLLQGEEARGKMWVNDGFDDWSPGITEGEWTVLQKRVWGEVREVLGGVASP